MSTHISTTKYPKVIILYNGEKNLTIQNYPNYEIIGTEEQKVNTPRFFNKYLEQELDNIDIIGFIQPSVDFIHNNTIQTMVDKLLYHPIIGCVYTDIITKDKYSVKQYYPAFNITMMQGQILILSPLFIKASLLKKIRFHENLKTLYLYLFLLQLSRTILSVHIPQHMFYYYDDKTILDMSSDYSYIQQWLKQPEIS